MSNVIMQAIEGVAASIRKEEEKTSSRKQVTKKDIAAHDFVVAYMRYPTMKKIATKLGITSSAVRSRALTLRKNGLDLPHKDPEPRQKIDRNSIPELRKLIAYYKKREKEKENNVKI